jgi:hypothetical protein
VSTLWDRAHGRQPRREKAAKQQCLTPQEEKALVNYALRMSQNGYPIPVKFLRSLAQVIVFIHVTDAGKHVEAQRSTDVMAEITGAHSCSCSQHSQCDCHRP